MPTADTLALQWYWFIVVTAQEKARRIGWINVDLTNIGRVFPEYTHLPHAVERALERLILFDWVVTKKEDYCPIGFKVPFVIRVDDDQLRRPSGAPDCSQLETTPQIDPTTGEEIETPLHIFDLSDSQTVKFKKCTGRADECLRLLEVEDAPSWPFLQVAIDNLMKAFFADGLEQLLWHVIVLEALLGERRQGLTNSLARRTAALLGTTKKKRKSLRKLFKQIYHLRSDLVHGAKFERPAHWEQLLDARRLARRVAICFVHYLSEITAKVKQGSWQGDVPKREDFLKLLDLGDVDRERLRTLLNDLPAGFPSAPTWS